jgi:hypothetical protein
MLKGYATIYIATAHRFVRLAFAKLPGWFVSEIRGFVETQKKLPIEYIDIQSVNK